MFARIVLWVSFLLVVAVPTWAGENPNAKLAMHVVASDEYLDCADLIPAACESINVDVSVEEILAANGYGYVALVAYDVEGTTGAEFAVDGWPTGRGAPVAGPTWCPQGALTLGDPMNGGGIATFPCVEAGQSGIVLLAYLSFGPLDEEILPIELEYAPSTFTYPNDPHNYVMDCTIYYREDPIVASTGCTIGGTQSEQPQCSGSDSGSATGDSGDLPGEPQLLLLGPTVQRAVEGGALFCIRGENLREGTELHFARGPERRNATLLGMYNQIAQYRGATTLADTGYWEIHASNEGVPEVQVTGQVRLVPSLASLAKERSQADWVPGVVCLKLRQGDSPLPHGLNRGNLDQATEASPELASILENNNCVRVERIFRVFPDQEATTSFSDDGKMLTDDDLARYVRLEFPETADIVGIMSELEILPEVLQVWPLWPRRLALNPLEPNDSIYVETGQWPLYSDSYPEADIDAPLAWGRDTVRTEIVVSINDTGVKSSHEDLGDTEEFPNWKVIAGWDFVDDDGFPDEPPGGVSHGTAMAGVAAACTDNEIGMASVAWGSTKLLAVRMTEGQYGQHQYSAEGIDYARTHGAEVICMGYYYDEPMPDEAAAIHNAHYFGEITCVASAGFDFCEPICHEQVQYPAGYPGVLGVTGSDQLGRFAGHAVHGDHVDLTAPGTAILTTTHREYTYGRHDGTSLAAAHAAGAAALLESFGLQLFNPLQYQLYPEDIVGVMLASADSLQWQPVYPPKCCGQGLLNLAKAMARLQYPFNEGRGPDRYVRYGADDTTVVRIFRPHPGSDTLYYENRVRKYASFGETLYDSVFAWGYHRHFTLGAIPGANDEDEMHWLWCRVVPGTVTSSACSLETTVYLRTVGGKPDGWVPCSPGGLTWWFGVSGIPQNLAVHAAATAKEAGSVVALSFSNPFSPSSSRLSLALARDSRVTLDVYNVSGKLVCRLLDRHLGAGEHGVEWNGTDESGRPLPSGVYFCRLDAGGSVSTKKMVFLR